MPDSQDPKQVNNNDLSNAQFAGGLVNAHTVNGRIGGDIYNIYTGQPSQKIGIDWHQVSSFLLNEQQRLTTNPLTLGEGITYRTEQVYVPLGLVERKKQSRRREDVSPEKGSELYCETEITQTFENKQFLEQVLKDRQSPKSQGRRIAIIGEPGTGKTTLLQQIAQWVSKEIEQSIVIWVSLAELRSRELESYLLEVWLQAVARQTGQAQASTQVQDDFVAQFNQGLVWLLLDGADEMQTTVGNPLGEIEQQIRTGSLLQQARIVVSCRLNVWDASSNALHSFDNYRTLEFSYPQQVEQFIGNWFGCLPSLKTYIGQQLCVALREPGKERIRDLVKNPLRLTLLCFSWYLDNGKLPQTKAELYEQFVMDFYEWKKGQITREQRKQLNAALKELAREAIDKEATRFRLRQQFVCNYLDEPDDADSLFAMALRLGWLNKVGVEAENPRRAVYAFFHPTFQEYFAALAIENWEYFLNHIPENPSDPDASYRVFEAQWREVIFLWFGRENVSKQQKKNFIKSLVTFEDGWENFYKYRAYFIAGVAIAEFQDDSLFHEIQNAFLQGEIAFNKDILMSSKFTQDFDKYRNSFQALPGYSELLSYENTNQIVSNIAILAFGHYYTDINKGWRNFLMPFGFQEAKIALQQTDRNRVITLLCWLIKNKQPKDTANSSNLIIEEAARMLGKIGGNNQAAVNSLEFLAKITKEETLLWIVADSLGKINPGNKIAHEVLKKLIQNAKHEHTRKIAAWSLGKINPGNSVAINALVNMIQSPKENGNRLNAILYLKEIDPNNQNVINILLQLLQASQTLQTRCEAAICLGEFEYNKEIAIKVLEEIAQNESIALRVAIHLASIDPNNPTVTNILEQNISNINREINCIFAAETLGRLKPNNQLLIKALEYIIQTTKDEHICQMAAGVLGKINPGNEIAFRALIHLIQTFPYDPVHLRVAETLNKILVQNQCLEVVKELKIYLFKKIDKSGDINRFLDCYKVIWYCAQLMPYSSFFEAWHSG
ncbi:MAG: NACHT domain-containing protein [Nostoc sp. DedQUE04]|uniref:NACHT domain-containing protein n=1 Tax=Nostoc sp. DedQUE04 TaxID=3075390 RepID=UPI002AD2FB37|nr:NACHT domain-containing protein [Nostoc sp. DedQUE04]MDZ8139691.1 NACHT domain-containing protein [Nostoc sp. DedQUE04]